MPCSPGDRLGPYEILALIGAGGMGEVYRAVDTRLGRKVAIKTSASEFTGRFQREAQAIAALNHPHICTLYDVGPNYLVMELVEGETLGSRLKNGKLSVEDTLRYGGQIAEALAEAHSRGITHRDLKPGNIMLGRNGVKVLDFGLAKSSTDDTATLTQVIMGTPAYMAPEQLAGKKCDARTDIYALGLVLREMATDPPPHLAHVIGRCLAKEPEDRWQTARDLKAELGWIPPQPAPPLWAPKAPRLSWVVAAIALLAIAGLGWWRTARPAPLRPLASLNLDMPDVTPLARALSTGAMFALSPDGARLALTLRDADGKVRLHTRQLDQNSVSTLAGTENAHDPFFSPDGEWIGFAADGKLKKISVKGGAVLTLCDGNLRGAAWGDDGNIIAALGPTGGLSRVPSSGGTPVTAVRLNPGEVTHRFPYVLPGSQVVLFTASPSGGFFDDATLQVASLKTGERKILQHGAISSPRYFTAPNGAAYLTYLRGSTLYAVPFDLSRLALAGIPSPILEDVSFNYVVGGDFAFAAPPSGPGTFVYLAGKPREGFAISWVDRAGKTEPLHAQLGVYWCMRLSPDGKRLAFSTPRAGTEDIWIKDLDRDALSRLSFQGGPNRWPIWAPDGKNIVFQSLIRSAPGLYWIRSDGSGEAQRLTDGRLNESPYSFSPDGKRLAFSADGNSGSSDIFTAAIKVDSERPELGQPDLFVGTRFQERYPAFSPDGHWLAYQSNESGTAEIYVRPFLEPGGRWQISTGGGTFPVWSRTGHELLFETLDGQLMAVNYTASGNSFAAGKPRPWTAAQLININLLINYDLAPEDKRIAAIVGEASPEKSPTRLTVLLNFSDELRRRAPGNGKIP